jgi:hypothetical protein
MGTRPSRGTPCKRMPLHRHRSRDVLVQGEVLIAVMLARERNPRRAQDADADGCTPLAAALAALPSRPLEMVAEAVAALGYADLAELLASPRRQSGNDPVLPAATDGAQWQVYNEQDWAGHETDPRGNGQYQVGY